MNPELERKLALFLESAPSSRQGNSQALDDIKRMVKDHGDTLDDVKTEVIKLGGRVGAIEQSEARCRADIGGRIAELEAGIESEVERTGRHELNRVQERLRDAEKQLSQAKASKNDWFTYTVRTVIGVIMLLATGALGWLVRAAFKVKFADSKTPRSVCIRPSNIAEYTRDDDGALVEQWLTKRGFILAGQAEGNEEAE